jgi:muconolactone delta-isomerase
MYYSIDWSNQLKKTGKILELYYLPDGRTMAICEHPSAEDLTQTLNSIPLSGFMHFEVFPLADAETAMKSAIESAKAAEKRFPAREMAGVR